MILGVTFTAIPAGFLFAHIIWVLTVIAADLGDGRTRRAFLGLVTLFGSLAAVGWWFSLLGLAGAGL